MSEEAGKSSLITVNTADIEAKEWLAKRDNTVAQAKAITKVTNDEELEIAGKIETSCKKQAKALSEIRLKLTRPLDEAKKTIMEREKELVKPLNDEQTRINKLTTAYATELARKAEEERRRREEAERAAAEAQLAAEQAAQEAAEKAAQANAAFGIASAPVPATPAPVPPAVPLPTITTTGPHTSSNRFVEKWDFTIVNANAVPRELCSPDEAKIRALLATKKAEGYKADQIKIEGVSITSSMKVYAR